MVTDINSRSFCTRAADERAALYYLANLHIGFKNAITSKDSSLAAVFYEDLNDILSSVRPKGLKLIDPPCTNASGSWPPHLFFVTKSGSTHLAPPPPKPTSLQRMAFPSSCLLW